jgi:proprotein convertase subtilisin/kexin type 5
VDSTLGTIPLPSQLLSRCYPYTCGTSSIVFTIGSYSITCLSGEGGVVKQLNALTGTLTCPHFNDYCTNSRKTCANWCSRSGFCMGGVCNCMPTNFGPDCSITACSQGEYYHPASQTCTSSCPSGTYPNKYSNTCEPCKSPCLQCINTPTNCIGCVASSADRFFYNGTCYRTCPNSTFASGLTCIACDQSVFCKTCSGSASLCTSCLGNLFLSQGSCVSSCAPPFSKIDRVHN